MPTDALCLVVVLLLGADLYLLTVHLGRARREIERERALLVVSPRSMDDAALCVQLPVFNEPQAAAAIDSLARLEWPHGPLQILVLDDSTDDTGEIAAARVGYWRARGVDIRHCPRTDRHGYKAGALADAFGLTAAPYIAVFDVDYRPDPGFLATLVRPLAARPDAAFVQARLDYRNREHSLFTRAQATGLDTYFAYEQAARDWAGIATPFNGTCAIWRRAAIAQAGGWNGASLLEDLDVSLRAFAAGWTGLNLVTVAAVGELPESPAALLSQRRRWALGTGQSSRRLPWRVLGTMRFDRAVVFCLLSLQHAALALVLLAALAAAAASGTAAAWTTFAATVALVVVVKSAGATLAHRAIGRALRLGFLVDLAAMWAMEAFLLPVRARAVVEGFVRRDAGPFERTPKKKD